MLSAINYSPSTVILNYERENLPASVRLFKPILIEGEAGYFCFWGPSPKDGVYGCGLSQQEAISDWVDHLKSRIESGIKNDPVAQRLVEADIDFE